MNKSQYDICTVEGCGRKHSCKSYCAKHYSQFRRNGRISNTRCGSVERYTEEIDKTLWTPTNIAWIAGILDGEGSFYYKKSIENKRGNVNISMTSADLDVLQKIQNILKIGIIYGPFKDKRYPDRKDTFHWSLYKNHEISELIVNILPWLSERRTKKAIELFNIIKNKYSNNDINIDYIANNFNSMTETNLAWLAGILEGEGSFVSKQNTFITVQSTDFDILDRIVSITNMGKIYKERIRNVNYKPIKDWIVSQKFDLINLIPKILPHLCSRRTESAKIMFNRIIKINKHQPIDMRNKLLELEKLTPKIIL